MRRLGNKRVREGKGNSRGMEQFSISLLVIDAGDLMQYSTAVRRRMVTMTPRKMLTARNKSTPG